uniref:Transthyretin-like family protein n=1 Tax=Parastrongyloides trichosuri TaxID=131310 RepID=A0A0N5A4P5_PARTI
MRLLISIYLIIFYQRYYIYSFRRQGVAVKGRILCNDKPAMNEIVKIFDIDRNPGDEDDLLDEKLSNKNGQFMLNGYTRELTTIEPELRIYFDCNDGDRPCMRMITIPVPPKYIHSGKVVDWYDIGQLDLYYKIQGERRSCDY